MPTFTGPFSLNPSQTDNFQTNFGTVHLRNLFEVGAARYYVTVATEGSNAGGQNTGNIWIQKSVNKGITWTLVYNGPEGAEMIAAQVVGTAIYIFGGNFNTSDNSIWVWKFDTGTDSMVSATKLSAIHDTLLGRGIAASSFNDGKILVSYYDTVNGGPACVLYDPVTNTISAVTDLTAFFTGTSPGVMYSVVDPISDLCIVFILSIAASVPDVWAIVVDELLNRQNAVLVYSLPITGAPFNEIWLSQGVPTVSGGVVIVPYINPIAQSGGSQTVLFVVRSTVATLLAFSSPETVANEVMPPEWMWTFQSEQPYGWGVVADGMGTLYAFYTVNANFNDDGTSHTQVWYRTSTTPGVWSAPVNLLNAPMPSSGLSIYPFELASGAIGVSIAYVDPVLYGGPNPNDQYNALTVVYFESGSPTPPGPTGPGIASAANFQVLPGVGRYCRYKLTKPKNAIAKFMKVGKGIYYPRDFVR
jgi:hypothetical protein